MEEHLSDEILSLHSKMFKWLKYFLIGVISLLVIGSTIFLVRSHSYKRRDFGYKEIDTTYTDVEPPPPEPYATVEKNDYEVPRQC